MRIIAGKFKGRTLLSPKNRDVRPTTDRVKESLFNLLSDKIDGARVLDLFSGSGALGIEALSRGAEYAVFCDNSRDSLAVTEANLKKIDARYSVERGDFDRVVAGLKNRGKSFDVVFVDPPYKKGIAEAAVKAVAEAGILSLVGVIAVERARDDSPTPVPSGYRIIDSRPYGSSEIELIGKATAAAVTGSFDPFTLGHKYLVEKAAELFDVVYVVMLVNPDKKPSISVEKRLKYIKMSLRSLPYKVRVDFFGGLTIDYMRENNIEYIVRGVRSPEDFEYESGMAKFNFENGGVKTLLVPARDPGISSGEVRERIAEHNTLYGFLDEEVRGILEDR